MFGISPKWIIAGIAALAVGTIITLAWNHYTGLLETVTTLEKEKTQLLLTVAIEKETNEIQAEALLEWQQSATDWKAQTEEMSRVAQQATAESRRLNAIFAEHDLTRLSLAKPRLIERRLNSGTARVGRLLVCATTPGCESNSGSPPPNQTDPPAPDSN